MNKFINNNHMSYESLKGLKKHNKAWKFLASTNAAFTMSFLYENFIESKTREISEYELVIKLNNLINENYLDNEKTAKDYLNDWASEEYGLLRKFYPYHTDEVHYDLTSDGQKAIEWILSLKQDSFVGNESRLVSIFHLLNEIVGKTNTNPEERIVELELQKDKIDQQIEQIKSGYIEVLDDVQIKERYIQAMKLSKEIISDFRQVEQNFRTLERKMKEDIAISTQNKGELLSNFFIQEESIEESEQGKSFDAFWRFLTSASQHDEFYKLINESSKLNSINSINGYEEMYDIENQWQKESRHVQSTIAAISKQLKRYLNDNFLSEEKRINQLISSIEKHAIKLKNMDIKDPLLSIDNLGNKVNLQFDRVLYTKPIDIILDDSLIEEGVFDDDYTILFDQTYLNKEELLANINDILSYQSTATLTQVLDKYPLKHGLAQLLLYIQLGLDSDNTEIVNEKEVISWIDNDSTIRTTTITKIIFKESENKHGR